MPSAPDDLLRQLRLTFQVEAAEHLQTLSEGLIALERNSEPSPAVVERVFRAVHSLKGAARAVELVQPEALCQAMEDVLAGWKRDGLPASPGTVLDAMHRAGDAMGRLLAAADAGATAEVAEAQAMRRELLGLAHPAGAVRSLFGGSRARTPGLGTPPGVSLPAGPHTAPVPASAFAPTPAPASAAAVTQAAPPGIGARHAADTPADTPPRPHPSGDAAPVPADVAPAAVSRRASVRVSATALDAQLQQAEEMLAAKQASRRRADELAALDASIQATRREWDDVAHDARILRRGIEQADGGTPTVSAPQLIRVLDAADDAMSRLRAMHEAAGAALAAAEQDRHTVAKLVDDLLEQSKSLMLLPFSTASTTLAKLVRDLCRDQGKEADLRISGDEVRLEKHVLEEIKDPLLHLLRNAVDHGVESPVVRESLGKPRRAALALAVTREGGNRVALTLTDDGAGIDGAAVAAAAVRAGVVSAGDAAAMTHAQACALVFVSAVTTRSEVTQLSGRGLGLAIAREKVEALGGELTVESERGRGTKFRMMLPMTRATFRGIVVRAAGRAVVMPTLQVERVGRAAPEHIRRTEGRERLLLEGRLLPLLPMEQVLELPAADARAPRGPDPGAKAQAPTRCFVVVAGGGDTRIALGVDAVVGEQEVLVKPLKPPLLRVRNVTGATILADGSIAPVLNMQDLARSSARLAGVGIGLRAGADEPPVDPAQARSVLLAEDSITSRMLLQGILEAAGYQVSTATDGAEAWARLRQEKFDLLVSDIEMPRLDGISLTQRIRADDALRALPVLLVTTLASREDRERGALAGANAYIVKGSFDQGDLIAAVRRLVGEPA